MPFAKIIGPVGKKWLKVDFNLFFLDFNFEVFPPWKHAKPRSCCFHAFKGEIYQTSNKEKIVKTFIKHCLKHIKEKGHKKEYFDVIGMQTETLYFPHIEAQTKIEPVC